MGRSQNWERDAAAVIGLAMGWMKAVKCVTSIQSPKRCSGTKVHGRLLQKWAWDTERESIETKSHGLMFLRSPGRLCWHPPRSTETCLQLLKNRTQKGWEISRVTGMRPGEKSRREISSLFNHIARAPHSLLLCSILNEWCRSGCSEIENYTDIKWQWKF